MFPGFEPLAFTRALATLGLPPPVEILALGQALINQSWVLVFPETARARRLVLRAVVASPGFGGVAAERAALRVAHLFGDLPIPREFAVLDPGWTGPALSLASFLPGTSGAVWQRRGGPGAEEALRQVGRVMATLEDSPQLRFATRATESGEFLPRACDWTGEIEALLDGIAGQIAGSGTGLGPLSDRLETQVRAALPALATARGWALVHGDLHPGNLLFEGPETALVCSGVVDWDRAVLGDPALEWALPLQMAPPSLARVLEGFGRERAEGLLNPEVLARLDLYVRLRCLMRLAVAGLPAFGNLEGRARALALEISRIFAEAAVEEGFSQRALRAALISTDPVTARGRPPAPSVLRRQVLGSFCWAERFGADEAAALVGALACAINAEGIPPSTADPHLVAGLRLIPRHDATRAPLPPRPIPDRAAWREALTGRVLRAHLDGASPVPCLALVLLAVALDAVDRMGGAVSDGVLRGIEAVVEGLLCKERVSWAAGSSPPDGQVLQAWLGSHALALLGPREQTAPLQARFAQTGAAAWAMLALVANPAASASELLASWPRSAGAARDPLISAALAALSRGVEAPGIAAPGAAVLAALRSGR